MLIVSLTKLGEASCIMELLNDAMGRNINKSDWSHKFHEALKCFAIYGFIISERKAY